MARPNKLKPDQILELQQLLAEYRRRTAHAEEVSPMKWAAANGIARSTLSRYMKLDAANG